MHAVATRAPTDRRLHLTGLQAYWRAVDTALAEEAAAIETAERAALAAARAALADAEAEHADLLTRIGALEATRGEVAAAPAARSDVASSSCATDDAAGAESAPAADNADTASTGTPDGAGSTIPVAGQDAEPRDAVATTALVTQADQEQSMKRADADVEPGADRPAAATAQAAATRRHAALAALDERLAPVRAERAEAEAALGSLVEANADLRARLAALGGAGAVVTAPS